ncbi:beta-ketoacyl synthase chain length factor [Crenobacter sp. SG2303]|uniref:Beta-ketoacyl synthase chain length factor n=1 Tax=Crenobacter oryzisoli TaxID=3056844 RepID=A0ABT7XKT2_9NEIS|nr:MULTISPECIES: beta-ketoacyl synthase chain length factor [unclassified Crenobacter]MDN0074383.1 beta-ketoacyl synthase chain length factor [Crenobacter sp. SG2303]MDN0081359.1 beta-ketoacyl synthase chain length factor [Crenobacter sp. SG2305]
MSKLSAYLDGVGALGPGFDNWPQLAAQLSGEAPWQAAPTQLPAPQALPPAERRRVGKPVRLALALGFEAATGVDTTTLATVFTASGGDGDNMHALCTTLAEPERLVSPTRFTNSVHNGPAGYWGIAARAQAPCNVLSAFDAGFTMGLLETLGQVHGEQRAVLLIAYDTPYPGPLARLRPLPDACGVALLLSPERSERSLARIELDTAAAPAGSTGQAELDALANSAPALTALPLLAALAKGQPARCALRTLNGFELAVELQPCA